MSKQCFWISIKDWFDIKKLKDLTDLNGENKTGEFTVLELKEAFGCNGIYKDVCNTNDTMVNFNISLAILNELIQNNFDNNTTFSKGLQDFANNKGIVVRIFYMTKKKKKINLPNNFDEK